MPSSRIKLVWVVSRLYIREGDLEGLPIRDGCLDATTLVLALHHQPEPGRVLAEARRVLRPGGRLLIVDMLPHDRDDYRRQMGHVWLGFSEQTIKKHLAAAGFEMGTIHSLSPEADAMGPALFATVAYIGVRTTKRRTRSQHVAELAKETA